MVCDDHDKYIDKDFKGEKQDNQLRNGPKSVRGCTDLLCCLIFIIYIIGFMFISINGFRKGNPYILATPFDPDGNGCGETKGFEEYPFIYFVRPTTEYLSYTVCVKKCPNWSDDKDKPNQLECKINSKVKSCQENKESSLIIQANNYVEIYKSTGFLDSVCVPDNVNQNRQVSSATQQDQTQTLLREIRYNWWIILQGCGIAIVIGFLVMIFLKFCMGVVTWSIIIIYFVGLIVLGYFSFRESKKTGANGDPHKDKKTLTIIAYASWGIAALSFLILICLCRVIRVVIAVLRSAADYVGDVFCSILVPALFFILEIGFFIFWIISFMYVFSIGEIRIRQKGQPFGEIFWDPKQYIREKLLFTIFGIIWVTSLIHSIQKFVLASSSSIWYFLRGEAVNDSLALGFYRAIRYHLGSLAFGSLILSILQMIKALFAYVTEVIKNSNQENSSFKWLYSMCGCCIACFDRFVKFITQAAYIQMAINGKGFCESSAEAYYLYVRNPFSIGVASVLQELFSFLGKISITIITAMISYLQLTKMKYFEHKISSPAEFTFIIGILAYSVSSLFMNVWNIAGRTILHCYFIDCEINNGSPTMCPEYLRDLVDINSQDKK